MHAIKTVGQEFDGGFRPLQPNRFKKDKNKDLLSFFFRASHSICMIS